MRSEDFMARYFTVNDGVERHCSSILKTPEGVICSYGMHYPLLFRVNGINWRNTRYYSATTSKHICWAGGLKDHDVELNPAYSTYGEPSTNTDEWVEWIHRSLMDELKSLDEQMQSKKRKSTAIYFDMKNRHTEVCNALKDINRP